MMSVEEYLASSYSPDREYLDGMVVERNLGEQDHSIVQAALVAYFFNRQKQWGLHVFPEQRVQVRPNRFRVPDLCVVLGPRPKEQIFTKPPFLCIEILSPEDRASNVRERIGDYLAFGVRYVWVLDPRTRTAYIHTAEGSHQAKGALTTTDPELSVSLAEVFEAE